MIIDNGTRVQLIIDGVFDGMAGLSAGRVAFMPNRSGRKPTEAKGGLLDGAPVRLEIVAQGGLYTASVELLT